MNPWMILAGAGLGYLKNKGDEKRWEDQKRIESTKARWSPWTGMKGDLDATKAPDAMGSMLQGGLTGAAFSQGMDDNVSDEEMEGAMEAEAEGRPQEGDADFRGPPRPDDSDIESDADGGLWGQFMDYMNEDENNAKYNRATRQGGGGR